MDAQKEKFLRNEFLTMSVLGALGRSRTYSENATEEAKDCFRNALREKLNEISRVYQPMVTEEEHLSNLKNLSDDLTSRFHHCLRNGRFRIGVAQKALNLYLKYLWCVNLIPSPPHCPFDSIVISYLRYCSDLNWTSIDTIEDYTRLVKAARRIPVDKPLTEWELEIWLDRVQSERERKGVSGSGTEKGQEGTLAEPFEPSMKEGSGSMITGTVVSQGTYADGKDICELLIGKAGSDRLPHEYGQKKPIYLTIRDIVYEAGVHETQEGVVWISSVLYKIGPRREKTRLVDALAETGLKKGDKVRIKANEDGTFLLEA